MPRSSVTTRPPPGPEKSDIVEAILTSGRKRVYGSFCPSQHPMSFSLFGAGLWCFLLCLLFLLVLSLMVITLVAMETVMSLAREGSMTSKSTVYSVA